MNKTKTQAVYDYLLTGAGLTVKDSVERFNLYALSQTLGKLKRTKGIPIQSVDEFTSDGTRYARYWLDKSYIAKVKSGEIKGLYS